MMTTSITYLLHVNLALVLVYLGYRLLLRKLTFFNLNRVYLLAGLVFAAVYPAVDFSRWWQVPENGLPVKLEDVMNSWHYADATPDNGWTPLLILAWGVAGYFMFRLLAGLWSIWRIHRYSKPAVWQSFQYRQVAGAIAPFSFWRSIYLNIHRHSSTELPKIFEHEQVHTRGLHTIDMLLAELCAACCWFNPAAWLLSHAVRENLEFLADRQVLAAGTDRLAYQYSLIQVGLRAGEGPGLANGFGVKQLKRRIAMMNRRSSSRLQLGTYLVLIPLVVAVVSVLSIKNSAKAGQSVTAHSQDTVRSIDPLAQNQQLVIVNRKPIGDNKQGGDPLFVIDGKIVTKAKLEALIPDDIQDISVLKGESARAIYGDRGQHGALVITTKAAGSTLPLASRNVGNTTKSADTSVVSGVLKFRTSGPEPLYVVDGKVSTTAEMQKIDRKDIQDITVLKGERAVDKYGDRGKNGVIEVTTGGHP